MGVDVGRNPSPWRKPGVSKGRKVIEAGDEVTVGSSDWKRRMSGRPVDSPSEQRASSPATAATASLDAQQRLPLAEQPLLLAAAMRGAVVRL